MLIHDLSGQMILKHEHAVECRIDFFTLSKCPFSLRQLLLPLQEKFFESCYYMSLFRLFKVKKPVLKKGLLISPPPLSRVRKCITFSVFSSKTKLTPRQFHHQIKWQIQWKFKVKYLFATFICES